MHGTRDALKYVLLFGSCVATPLTIACDGAKGDEQGAAAQAPAKSTEQPTAAAAPPTAPAGPGVLALPTDAKALPTSAPDIAAILTDPCQLLPAETVASFLTFVKSQVALEKLERRDRGACNYLAAEPETKLEVWFDSTKQLRSSEKAIELAGIADVRLRVLGKSAELAIPFAAAKDSSKMPADRLYFRLTLFENASFTQPYPGPPRPDPADLEAVLRQLGENAIVRLH